jgi:hypothetical protein
MVSDHGSGGQSSQTRTHFFLYEPEAEAFVEVFNELTTYLPGCTTPVYSSEILLGLGEEDLCDIVVDTTFWVSSRRLPRAERRTVFRWNGTHYEGRLPDPAEVLNWPKK